VNPAPPSLVLSVNAMEPAAAMPEPVIVTVSHELGKEGARQRIEAAMGRIRKELSPFASSIEDRWTGDRLDLRLVALGQTVTASLEAMERIVRIEVLLPGLLGVLAGRIAGRIRDDGTKLLGREK
jgi:Putative polyhydroxyalkanoic acid system protein (PHA_gran_rgn)